MVSPMATVAGPPRKAGAEARLVDAVTQVVDSDGYVHLTVERILAGAGVSRATFYQYFSNVDDCFWSAYRQHAERLVSEVTAAARYSRNRGLAVLDAVVDVAASRPDVARLLMREGLAAGPAGLSERDGLMARIEKAMTESVTQECTIDLPPEVLIGATFRFLSMRLTDRSALDTSGDELREWLEAFARLPTQPSWTARLAPESPHASRSPMHSIKTLPHGTPRERILYATTATIRTQSYHDTSVADIVGAAGVSRRSFYNEFPSKADAFIASYEHGFQQTLAACTPAFFSARAWPERVWHGAQALTRFLAREPLIAYLGFVECYAIGPGFAPRVHDTQLAFTLFLEDGYRQRPHAQSLSRACSALTATALIELGFQVSRRGPDASLRRMQPLAVYIALAPFIGREAAGEFVMGKLAAKGSAPPTVS